MAFTIVYPKKKGHDEVFMLFLLFSSIEVWLGGHILYAITVFDRIISFFQNLNTVTSFEIFIARLNGLGD